MCDLLLFFFFQAEDGIRDVAVTGVQTCALPILLGVIAGYHTEYSAMKFSMFYIAEYSNMVTASALVTTLFFGGYDIPFKIGRASCRGRGEISVGAGSFKKKKMKNNSEE